MSTTQPIRYAGFWKRLTAYGWDSLIVTLITVIASQLLGSVAHAQTMPEIEALISAGFLPAGTNAQNLPEQFNTMLADLIDIPTLFIAFCTSAIYNIFCVTGNWQATPGKRWCGIKVIMEDGSKPTLAQSTFRHAASGLSTMLGGLGYITIPFTRQKLAWHDAIAKTRVIYNHQP